MDRGLVLSRVLDLASDGDDPESPSIWASSISEPSNHEVQLTGDAGNDELSDAEAALLDEIFQQHGHMNRWQLVKLTHKLPEWKDPQGSAIPINYRDILKAGGKSELAELAEADLVLLMSSRTDF